MAVGGRATPTWEAAVYAFLAESLDDEDLVVRVRSEGEPERLLQLPAERMPGLAEDGRILETIGLSPLRPRVAPVIGEVLAGEPAQQAGLQPGDEILIGKHQLLRAEAGEVEQELGEWWTQFQEMHPEQREQEVTKTRPPRKRRRRRPRRRSGKEST